MRNDCVTQHIHGESILTREYFPRASRFLSWAGTPLGSLGLIAGAALLCGLVVHPRGFLVLFGILAVIGLGLSWPWLSMRGIQGQLQFDHERAREGENVGFSLSVTNRWPWAVCGVVLRGVIDPTGSSPTQTLPPLVGIASLPARRKTEIQGRFTPDCRGVYPITAPWLSSGFPFGLVEAGRSVTLPARLLVWPRTFAVGPIPRTIGRADEGLAPRDSSGNSGDVLGVRRYRRGDSLRRIHWSQTARQGELIVCELQTHAAPRAQIILDTHRDAHGGDGPHGSLEWSIRIAASFLEAWIADGAEMELVAHGQVIRTSRGTCKARQSRFLDALTRLEPHSLLALGDQLDLPACRQFRGGVRLIVTTDRACDSHRLRSSLRPSDLLVVLQASAFQAEPPHRLDTKPDITPWIWVDDPRRIPERIRNTWKEGSLGC